MLGFTAANLQSKARQLAQGSILLCENAILAGDIQMACCKMTPKWCCRASGVERRGDGRAGGGDGGGPCGCGAPAGGRLPGRRLRRPRGGGSRGGAAGAGARLAGGARHRLQARPCLLAASLASVSLRDQLTAGIQASVCCHIRGPNLLSMEVFAPFMVANCARRKKRMAMAGPFTETRSCCWTEAAAAAAVHKPKWGSTRGA